LAQRLAIFELSKNVIERLVNPVGHKNGGYELTERNISKAIEFIFQLLRGAYTAGVSSQYTENNITPEFIGCLLGFPCQLIRVFIYFLLVLLAASATLVPSTCLAAGTLRVIAASPVRGVISALTLSRYLPRNYREQGSRE
jgi:hypothetical protein